MLTPRKNRYARLLAAAAALAFVAAACGDDSDDDPVTGSTETTEETTETTADEPTTTEDDGDDAEVPEGWTVIEGDGVAMALPDGWEGVPMDEAGLTADDLAEALPDQDRALLEQAEVLIQRGGRFLAFGEVQDGFATNVNVLEIPGAGGAPLDDIEEQAQAGLETTGATIGGVDQLELGGWDVVRIDYSMAVGGAAGSEVRGLQYYVVSDREAYVITFTGLTLDEDVAEQAVASFHVL